MNGHTPGPWHAGRVYPDRPNSPGCDIGANDGSNIAIVIHDKLDRDVNETTANARLIASAPDLLDVLEAVELAWVNLDGLPFEDGEIGADT